jgi:hypothetical protein
VRETLGRTGGQTRSAHESVYRHGGEGERLLVAVAAETDEQRLLVEQPDASRERVDLEPGLERGLLDSVRDRHLALAAALAAHIQPVVAGVGPRTAQIAGAQAAEFGRAQPAVSEHPQERVVALARDRAPVGDAQQVAVVGIGKGFGPWGTMERKVTLRPGWRAEGP